MGISTIDTSALALSQQNNTTGTGSSTMGEDEFLELLVAQMSNQDPMNPMDGTEYASQLAQFSSVEQLIAVNDGLEDLLVSQELMSAGLTNSMAASLTGKQVRALSDKITLGAEGSTNLNFELNDSAQSVEIIIRTEGGAEVRRETLEGAPGGDNTWEWDGRNSNGERMGEGTYTIEVVATNDGVRVDALTFAEGIADKVRYTASGVYLTVNGIDIPIGNVEEIGAGNSNNE
ncbi:MAG: hypothetical protein MI700_05530 [Balneolales bacterium]|nr:hypothetical protein [Balneolales bacterium]